MGALKNWLCAAGARMALRARQHDEREVPDEARAIQDLEGVLGDPELDYLKAHYRAEFRLAFREALASLSARQRNVLRLYVVDGVSSEQIGLLHQVHRGTVARWISECRQLLLERTRVELARRLGLSESELESLIVLVRSHLNVSLAGLMKDEPER